MTNKDASDAFSRISDARNGYLVDASDEFLINLRHQAERWAEDIKIELDIRARAAAYRARGDR
jgi:hypothetical protein